MAEEAALVENLPVNRFYCHKCNREITAILADFTCANCQSGFIEALENAPEQNDDSDMEVDHPFDEAMNFFQEILFASSVGDRHNRTRRGRRTARLNRARQIGEAPLEALIQDFVMNLSEVGFGNMGSNTIGVGTARAGGGPVRLVLGNPGDYAWGREGLDAIVTQLLNQMEPSGPPPLAKDKINEIPFSVITKEQVDINLQCSVCWEDFKVEEPVRKLPCEHVYHNSCLIPWLELHGTCPICRKALIDDPRNEDSDGSTLGNGLATLFRLTEANTRTPSASSSSSSTGNTRSASASRSSRPDFNMDVEFD